MYAGTPEEQVMVNEWVKVQLAKRTDVEEPGLRHRFYFMPYMVKFEVEGWKWYDSFEEIQWLEKLFADYVDIFCRDENSLDDKRTYAIEFCRVGENYEDIVLWEKGASERKIYVQRTIMIDTD
jgi:hypothetical protein